MGHGRGRDMRLTLPTLLLCALLAACSPQSGSNVSLVSPGPAASGQAAVHPQSGLAVIPLTIEHGGVQHRFRVEVARTPAEQSRRAAGIRLDWLNRR